ncbi:hypothetical protein [Bauldia sp.]|uniref:hypothetical protein n=1 Tax=Bauldia sp. TaxID=2575872 RepID=UPI003BA8CE07
MSDSEGLADFLQQPLAKTLWGRRTHRVSRGSSVTAGSMSYVSENAREPLSPLEEAILIASTGASGMTMPDRPFADPDTGETIMSKPNLTMDGRTAGSPDNAQGTYFFLINDEGTYFLRHLPSAEGGVDAWTPENLIARAEESKVQLLDHRIDVPEGMRDFPAYLDSNRFLSNLPGTTILFPVVDLSHQYINGLMYLLTQPGKARPTIVDDRNFYRLAGVKKWVDSGFLNPDIKIPLGVIQQMRTQLEATLLTQNIFLVAEAMGLGAWIHGAISPPVLMGDPKFRDTYGKLLDFDHVTPPWKFLDFFRWATLPIRQMKHVRSHAVGLRHKGETLIKGMCPPYYDTMSEAVDEVIADKFGPDGIYKDTDLFRRIYKDDYGDRYLDEAAEYGGEVIECTRAICEYIYETHGRFPAHCEAIHAPGIWIQVHLLENEYYDRFFEDGMRDVHRDHDALWR